MRYHMIATRKYWCAVPTNTDGEVDVVEFLQEVNLVVLRHCGWPERVSHIEMRIRAASKDFCVDVKVVSLVLLRT
jgi:hypothetical protein